MARKPRSEWSLAYRQRIERAEEKARREGVPFTKSSARGHSTKQGKTEYQRRKESEQRRSGQFSPLTPSQIKQMRSFGATDSELLEAAKVPQARIRKHLKEQRERMANPKYKAPWTIAEMIEMFPDEPPFMFFYHNWR